MPANARCWFILLLCLILAGCGTSVTALLQENSELFWRAEEVIGAADELDRDLGEPVYDAEDVRQKACQFLTDATAKQMFATETPFMEQFRSDLERLLVLIVPVERVESCAEAQKHYKNAIETLCQDLRDEGVSLRC